MDEPHIPNDLLSLVYATAGDSSKWPEFCTALHRYSGTGILLFGHDVGVNEGAGLIGGGFEPREIERYEAYFADKNPWMHMNVVMPVGMVGVSDQALSQRDLFKTEFYNDWLRHQDNVVGGPAMMCYRSKSRFVAMAAACRETNYDRKVVEATAILQALAPHMVKSIELSAMVAKRDLASTALIDGLAYGVILLRRSGTVAHANRAAEHFLAMRPGLSITMAQKLTAATDALQAFVAKAVGAVRRMDFARVPAPIRLADRQFGKIVLHAHVFPDAANGRFPGALWADPVSGAILIANPRQLGTAGAIETLAETHGATPAEARLAAALVKGESLNAYADRKSLSRHTVRNQLRALLHKTGTRSQADFIRHMLTVSSPLTPFER